MLINQTLDKMRALHLGGMAEALEEQRRQGEIARLDFEDRLGLLIDRQWSWKENRGLETRLKKAQLKIAATLEDINYRHPRNLKRARNSTMPVSSPACPRSLAMMSSPCHSLSVAHCSATRMG